MKAGLASFASGVQLRLKLDEATSNKDDPTPIYLMDEAAAMVGSNVDNINTAVDHIVRRLNHKSPTVKQKALRLVRHMCTKGSPEFRRAMARQSSVIRELTGFRCEPDPFKGDIPWKRVQQLAQEALGALHAAPEQQGASGLGGRIQGFGSDVGGGGGGGGGYGGGGSRMVGFGSDSMPAGGGGYGGGGGSSRMVGFGSDSKPPGGYSAVGGGPSGGSGSSLLGSLSGGMRSLAAPGRSGDSLLAEDGYGAANGASGYSAPSAAPLPGGLCGGAGLQRGGSSGAGTSAGAGSQEARVVDKVCTPAGLRAAPDREDLRAFVEAVSSLDGQEVARLLQERMERGPWQATLRALCAVEAVIESGSSASCGEVAVHFQANPDPVRRAAGSAQASVRQRADKVLRLIGDETLPREGTAPAAAPQGSLVGDLLGEAEGSQASPSAQLGSGVNLLGEPSGPAAAAQPSGSVEDLLGTLEVPAAAATGQQGHSGGPVALSEDLFGGLSLPGGAGPAPAAAAAPAMAATSLLGPSGSQAAARQQQQEQQQQNVAAAGLSDLFSGLAVPSQPAPAAGGGMTAAAADLFSGLSVGAGSPGAGGAAAAVGAPLAALAPVPAPNQPQQQQQQQQQQLASKGSNSLEDLLSDLNITHSAAQHPMKPGGVAGGATALAGGAPGPPAQQVALGGFAAMGGMGSHPAGAMPGGMMGVGGQQPFVQAGGLPGGQFMAAPGMVAPGQLPRPVLMVPPHLQQQLAGLPPMQQAAFLQQYQQQQMMLMQQAAMLQQQAAMGSGVGAAPFMMMGLQPPQMPGGGLASAGSGGGRGAIPLEEFHDTISHQPPAAHKKDSSFDFIGDHLQGLKKK